MKFRVVWSVLYYSCAADRWLQIDTFLFHSKAERLNWELGVTEFSSLECDIEILAYICHIAFLSMYSLKTRIFGTNRDVYTLIWCIQEENSHEIEAFSSLYVWQIMHLETRRFGENFGEKYAPISSIFIQISIWGFISGKSMNPNGIFIFKDHKEYSLMKNPFEITKFHNIIQGWY